LAWVLVGQKRKHHFSGQQVFYILEVLHEHGAYDGVERVDGRPWGAESGGEWSGVKGGKKSLLFWLVNFKLVYFWLV
jgi:hypothetical protein